MTKSGLRWSAREHHLAELSRLGAALGELHVVLGARRLMAGGDLAVHPAGALEEALRFGDLLGGENVGNL